MATAEQTHDRKPQWGNRLTRFIAQNAMPLLIVFGLGVVALGIWVSDDPPTKAALVVMGSAAVILGLLRYHLEGHIWVGPSGFRGTLIDPARLNALTTEVATEAVDEVIPADSASGKSVETAALKRKLAEKLAQHLSGADCAECGEPLSKEWQEPVRRPCPNCGATSRSYTR